MDEEAKRVPTNQAKTQTYAYPGLVDRYGDYGSRLWAFDTPCLNRIIVATHSSPFNIPCDHSA